MPDHRIYETGPTDWAPSETLFPYEQSNAQDRLRLIERINAQKDKEVLVLVDQSWVTCRIKYAYGEGVSLIRPKGDTLLVSLNEVEKRIQGLDLPPGERLDPDRR